MTTIPFTTRAGAPLVIEVTGVDGKRYELRVATSVFDVEDSGDVGNPGRFKIKANWAVDVKEVPAPAQSGSKVKTKKAG